MNDRLRPLIPVCITIVFASCDRPAPNPATNKLAESRSYEHALSLTLIDSSGATNEAVASLLLFINSDGATGTLEGQWALAAFDPPPTKRQGHLPKSGIGRLAGQKGAQVLLIDLSPGVIDNNFTLRIDLAEIEHRTCGTWEFATDAGPEIRGIVHANAGGANAPQ